MEELRETLVVEDGDSELRDKEAAANVVDCCLSLIAHDLSTGEVRFIHPSVQRWFDHGPQHQKLLPHDYLAKSCLTYLAFNVFDHLCYSWLSVKERVEQYKFSRYAAQFWDLHTRGEAENEPDIQRAVLSLLASENKKNSMLQLEDDYPKWFTISFTKSRNLLQVLANNGLARVCKLVLHGRINGNDTYALEVDI
jgi:hypothetical protein